MDYTICNNPITEPFPKSPSRKLYLSGSRFPSIPSILEIENLARHHGWLLRHEDQTFYRVILPDSQTRRTPCGGFAAALQSITCSQFADAAKHHLNEDHVPSPFVTILSDLRNAVFYARKVSKEKVIPLKSIELAEIDGAVLGHILVFKATLLNKTLQLLKTESWKVGDNAWLCLYEVPVKVIKILTPNPLADLLDKYEMESKSSRYTLESATVLIVRPLR